MMFLAATVFKSFPPPPLLPVASLVGFEHAHVLKKASLVVPGQGGIAEVDILHAEPDSEAICPFEIVDQAASRYSQ